MNLARKRQGYLFAVLGALLVFALRFSLRGVLGEQALLLPFVVAVMGAAWWGGLGPGLLATALCFLMAVFFLIPPFWSLWVDRLAHGLSAATFVVVGVMISILCEALHDARRRDAEKQFRTLADSIPQLVWMARPDGYRFWFNQRWTEFTGATSQQLEGDNWQCLCEPTYLPQVQQSWRDALQSGQPWEQIVPLARHDGAIRWHLSRAMPVHDGTGSIVCWFGTSTDISERFQIEQALADANRHKDDFLAVLGHELRNSLMPINLSFEHWPLVEDDKPQRDQTMAVMRRGVKQITRLIDDLLDVSRIGRGQIRLLRESVDIGQAVSNVLETIRPQFDAGQQMLTVSLPDEPIIVQADVGRLSQVFGNLLLNAAKFTPAQGHVAVAVEQSDQYAIVRIRDDGLGIPRSMLSQIFEMYRQAENTAERSQGGLGIGLTLVKRLVELHGGSVEARSDGPGKGSEFSVKLPIHATSSGELAVAGSIGQINP
ncbi:MAG TPA: ATP-binding protein [Pirellulales bacterium]|nr:ATP-binding protein [Pirellulales bacterium]